MEILSGTLSESLAHMDHLVAPGSPVEVMNPAASGPIVLTCEHASYFVPSEYRDLGLGMDELQEHIGWDIGARALTEYLSARFASAAVASSVSRLVIDCNRALDDDDLIVAESHNVRIPGNAVLDHSERQRRIRNFHEPYHRTIDAVLATRQDAFLLSLHSFTPSLNGEERCFDVGVLFDIYEDAAYHLGRELIAEGFETRYNQPYSAFDGLIFSASAHGRRHELRYLELEVNNRLLRDAAGRRRVGVALERALARFLEVRCVSF